ncbi:deleted in malignant brain tumors 1 protein-like [Dendronephthya gigantea]|uniref:deleted in malignant brain tumors 1 protein-like n=1 Tax=Dendronephthya gigantea TaxID=151771 RepID=UPI00106D9817|nr:deleted in malignant brain tumors 1 protein-like [Dendronephthya gigantea]XP_028407347.1 deleted in malignant brain tumors 1 protein-like [Dendronephthya gigantea]XP_028407348.1 deleted in malignant brain tumors 1 protein-like [Dendronephthya gigantea]
MRSLAIIPGIFFVLCFVIHWANSTVRLQGPLRANGTGRVEVFYRGEWGTICEDGWDMRDARVVCRQLGYNDSVRTLERNEVPDGSGQIWLSHVSCTGNEQNITNCSHGGWGNHRCSHNKDAGVECTNTNFTGIPVRLRLQGPSSANGTGRVEVFYHGLWGTICDDGWDIRDARVVCRQLGYKDVVRIVQKSEVPDGSGQIWLSHVSCTGNEQNIRSCSHRGWGSHRCSHRQNVGVECTYTDFTTIPVRLRLQGPSSVKGIGRLEVLYRGHWGTICRYGWDMRDAIVSCRELGYKDVVRTLQGRDVPSGSGKIWLSQVYCTGNEPNLTSCSHDGWENHLCTHYEDVGVECTNTLSDFTVIPIKLRLQGPSSTYGTGRVEILYHGYWGTICDRGWDVRDARVFCRQLGFQSAVRILPGGEFPFSSGQMWLSNVSCTGNEKNISSCSHDGWGTHSCSNFEDAGVECKNTDFIPVRLHGPSGANGTGRVEVFHRGEWGKICDDGWDMRDARVVCRQLGYKDVLQTFQEGQVSEGSDQIWLSHVHCTGDEQNLKSCPHRGWGGHRCLQGKVAGVECTKIDFTPIPVRLRLQGPLSANGSGRVEVLYHGVWGTICDDGWDMIDARVVCRQLGYKAVVRNLHEGEFPSGSGQIWLSDLSCTGNEQNITGCSHGGWGIQFCSHREDVGVECTADQVTETTTANPTESITEESKSDEESDSVEWPIFMIIPAVIIAGIIIACIALFYRSRWLKRKNVKPDPTPENTIKNPVFDESNCVRHAQNLSGSGGAVDNAGYVTNENTAM